MIYYICLFLSLLCLTGCGNLPAMDEIADWLPSGIMEEKPKDYGADDEDAAYDCYFLRSGSTFAYDTLNSTEKLWYRDMENILGSFEEEKPLSKKGLEKGLGEEDVDRIFQCVMIDHPELFFVEGYNYTMSSRGDKVVAIAFSGTYNVSRKNAEKKWEEIQENAAELLAGVASGADDYEKIRYVYEKLIDITDYDLDAPDNQNIYSVFVEGRSVCQGYAKATQYLLNELGVECTLVQGSVQGGAKHGWNLVKSNGKYYYVDTTWGDSSYQPMGAETSSVMSQINYDYLCVTTHELEKTHIIQHIVDLPECDSLDDNYYVRQGYYYEYMDEDKLRKQIAEADPDSGYYITLKCANQDCYEDMYDKLIVFSGIFDFYPSDIGGMAYIENDQQCSMSFWVTNE